MKQKMQNKINGYQPTDVVTLDTASLAKLSKQENEKVIQQKRCEMRFRAFLKREA